MLVTRATHLIFAGLPVGREFILMHLHYAHTQPRQPDLTVSNIEVFSSAPDANVR